MDIEPTRHTLLQKQNELLNRLAAIEADLRSGRSRDSIDQAQERENDDVLNELSRETGEELVLIHHALNRIKNKTYGRCTRCDEFIDTERLSISPEAESCVQCAANN